MVAQLNLLVIRSADVEAAARFYEVLGLRFVRHSHGSGPMHLASEDPGCVFEIYPLGAREESRASIRLGFQVASVDQSLAGLISAGGTLVSGPKLGVWGYRAVVADHDGHRVELTSVENREPAASGIAAGS